jgi:hypothetical protein
MRIHLKKVLLDCVVTLLCICSIGYAAIYSSVVALSNGTSVTVSDKSYTSNTSNQCGVYVYNSGSNLTLNDSVVLKSGDSSDTNYSNYYGLNAAVLADVNGKIIINDSSIITKASGATAAFATNGASITLTNVAISCSSSNARGLDVTYGGSITATDVIATITGSNGHALIIDRGGGAINVIRGTYTVSGSDCVGVYSAGEMNISSAVVISYNGFAAVVEGSNTVTMSNTDLTGGVGTYGLGIMLYNSAQGDMAASTGCLTMRGGSYTWPSSTGPAFYVTNGSGVIDLEAVTLTNSSTLLLKAASGGWGTSGSNGGNVTLFASSETLTGDMFSDSISAITASLKNSTTLTGSVNSAALAIDPTCVWKVTANSVLSDLNNSGIVIFNPPTSALSFSSSYKTAVVDSYAGSNGIIIINAYFNGNSSTSDSIEIHGGTAGGATVLKLNNTGVLGALPVGSGILMVSCVNGGTTSPSAFTLYGGTVCVNGGIYKLVRGAMVSNNPSMSDNWYLCSLNTTEISTITHGNTITESRIITVQGGPSGYAEPGKGYFPVIHLKSPAKSGQVTITLYTVHNARIVKTLERDVIEGCAADLTWDCRNIDSEMVGSGVYVAVVDGAGYQKEKVKIGVLK